MKHHSFKIHDADYNTKFKESISSKKSLNNKKEIPENNYQNSNQFKNNKTLSKNKFAHLNIDSGIQKSSVHALVSPKASVITNAQLLTSKLNTMTTKYDESKTIKNGYNPFEPKLSLGLKSTMRLEEKSRLGSITSLSPKKNNLVSSQNSSAMALHKKMHYPVERQEIVNEFDEKYGDPSYSGNNEPFMENLKKITSLSQKDINKKVYDKILEQETTRMNELKIKNENLISKINAHQNRNNKFSSELEMKLKQLQNSPSSHASSYTKYSTNITNLLSDSQSKRSDMKENDSKYYEKIYTKREHRRDEGNHESFDVKLKERPESSYDKHHIYSMRSFESSTMGLTSDFKEGKILTTAKINTLSKNLRNSQSDKNELLLSSINRSTEDLKFKNSHGSEIRKTGSFVDSYNSSKHQSMHDILYKTQPDEEKTQTIKIQNLLRNQSSELSETYYPLVLTEGNLDEPQKKNYKHYAQTSKYNETKKFNFDFELKRLNELRNKMDSSKRETNVDIVNEISSLEEMPKMNKNDVKKIKIINEIPDHLPKETKKGLEYAVQRQNLIDLEYKDKQKNLECNDSSKLRDNPFSKVLKRFEEIIGIHEKKKVIWKSEKQKLNERILQLEELVQKLERS